MSDRAIVLTDEDQRRLRALALEVPGDVWEHAVGPLLSREPMPAVACVLCALKAREDPEAEWITPGIYIVNGQSVCGKHVETPYGFPDHGLGGMVARRRAQLFDATGRDHD